MKSIDNKAQDLTIVVNTCDAYHDVLGIFFRAFRDFWPNCPYPMVINTETNTTSSCQALVHTHRSSTGSDDWGARLLSTLNSIETEYVLMLYDDFILDAPVDNGLIQRTLELLAGRADTVVAYLINTARPLVTENGDALFFALKDRQEYRLNSAPAIWRKQALAGYTAAGDTPWAWEVFGSYRSWSDGRTFLSLNPQHPDIYSYNYAKGGAIYRGKWVREVVEQVAAKYSLNIDWTQRGFSSDVVYEKRSIIWKIRFMQTGFKMVGFKAIYFVLSYIKIKISAH